jgi:short-subunit dehydrogenase
VPQPVAVITGASGGLGQALCTSARARGYRVVEISRKIQVHEDAIKVDLGSDAHAFLEVREGLKERSVDGVDLLINNAGMALMSPVMDSSWASITALFGINCLAPLMLTQTLWPMLAAKQGKIINIGSIASRLTVPTLSAYSATKKGLLALTDGARIEGASDGIQAGYVELGNVATGLHAKVRQAAEKNGARIGLSLLLDRSRALEARALRPERAAELIFAKCDIAKVPRIALIGRDAHFRYWLTKLAPNRVIERRLITIYAEAMSQDITATGMTLR